MAFTAMLFSDLRRNFREGPVRAGRDRSAFGSEIYHLRNGECILKLDTEVAHRAVHFHVAKQELDYTEIASFAIYL